MKIITIFLIFSILYSTIAASKDFVMGPLVEDFGAKKSDLSSFVKLNTDLPAGNNLTFHWELIPATSADKLPSSQKYSKIKIAIEKTSVGWAAVGWGNNMWNGNVIILVPGSDKGGSLNVSQCK